MLDSGEDSAGIGFPDEWLRVFVVVVEEPIDGGLQVGDRVENAALQPTLGERGKEPFDGIDPRTRCRREVEREPRCRRSYRMTLGCLWVA